MEDLRKVKKIGIDNKIKSGTTFEDFRSKEEKRRLVKEKELLEGKISKVITFDIETWGLVPNNLALAIFYDGDDYSIFYTIDEVIEYIENLDYYKVSIFAHNGAKFDYSIFLKELIRNNYKLKKDGNVIKILYKNKKQTKIVLRDTIYMLQGSLDSLGKSFCNSETQKLILDDKFKYPIKYGFNREEYNKNVKEFNLKHITNEDIEYCKRDCEVLHNIIHNEYVLNDLDILNNNTIASIAFEKLEKAMIKARKIFYKSKGLEIEDLASFDINKSIDKAFKETYKGGLTFVLKNITHINNKVLYLDVNSMYPGVMTQLFPDTSKLKTHYYDRVDEDKNEWLNMILNYPNGLSNVVIKVREDLENIDKEILKTIPLIQYSENSGMNYFNFSDGSEYRLTILNEEINLLLEFFEIDVEMSIYCEEEDLYYPFRDYMIGTYEHRKSVKNTKESLATILKLLMNSSYGRLGMQTQRERIIKETLGNIKKWLYEIVENKVNILKDKVLDRDEIYEYITKEVDNHNIKNIEDWDYDIFKKHNNIDEELLYLINYININDRLFNEMKITSFIKLIDKDYKNERYEYKDKEDIYLVSFKTMKVDSNNSNFCLAAHITSKARIQLQKMMIKIKRSGLGNVCYCDTDSVHIETNNIDSLEEYLKDDINPNELGKWKKEGVYDLGIWFAKKHYGLFNYIDNKYILDSKKFALKGFQVYKPIDWFIENRNVEVVKKIFTTLKHLELDNQNQIYMNKSFMNFTINTNKNNELFEYKDFSDIQEEIDEKRKFLQDLFFKICEIVYVENDGEIVKVSEIKEQRMKELNDRIEENIKEGLYEIDNIEILNDDIRNQILKSFKEIKEKKPRKSRAKFKINFENVEEFLEGA